jgi:hypothetical protein
MSDAELLAARSAEIKKYERAYQLGRYRLGQVRRDHIVAGLKDVRLGSLLDVSTGRGEVLEIAEQMGFGPVLGTEAVAYLCDGERVLQSYAHALPVADQAFDVVTFFDVMEHLVPEDTIAVCRELERAAKRTILLTVHNGRSIVEKMDLHINRRESYEEWFDFFKQVFSGRVDWILRGQSISEMFKVTYGSR